MVEYQEVFLRPIDDHDTEKIVNWRNKTEVRQHFVYQKPFTKASHQQWMKTMVETKKVVQFIITVKETEKEIGSVFLRDVDLENQKAEFGIFIGETVARNKGYGTPDHLAALREHGPSPLHRRSFAPLAQHALI